MSLLPKLLSLALLAIYVQATPASSSYGRRGAGHSGGGKVASTWWTNWHASDFPVSALSWEKYTRVTFAFAETTPDVHSLNLSANLTAGLGESLLTELVAAGHQHGVQVAVSIGGWTGSRWYSSNVATPENRTAFVKTVVGLATTYDLDGLDFDWEYPGNQGIGCNVISPNDTSNFLSFLQELRSDPVGAKLVLSAATSIVPFYNSSGKPSTDVSAFSKVLDFIEVMNYDVWGSWSTGVGPNSPLNDTCAPTLDQQGSAVSALKAWTSAGMPAHQLVLGVAAYGHSFRVNHSQALDANGQLTAYPAFNASDQPVGDKWDDPAAVDECGAKQGPGGQFTFWGMMDAGFLTPTGHPAEGIDYRYDTCSQTPYVYNTTSDVMISFDNARSFAEKGRFIDWASLGGFAMWEAGGDRDDILLDAIRAGGKY
ncbi:glycoside hydrolase family 18 protein [Jaapia argillacea MUCL 33604]|uniref:Glycoside hydrolase family 18 protein n=1 Tax=Jaapia argillacea MUCL 33604 TaxID=933084 RepID=A0A067PZB8_9AGAM|nr:glycoside hydrolase family 18 protein [Jaapia argillacea MUCL 33604]